MKTLTINLPNAVEMTSKETSTILAVQLYKMGKLSLGQAADMAGYTKRTFMELLADYGVSVFNFPPAELDSDLSNAKNNHI